MSGKEQGLTSSVGDLWEEGEILSSNGDPVRGLLLFQKVRIRVRGNVIYRKETKLTTETFNLITTLLLA